eukprot:scaffold5731_cov239-Pinguiococcus_pyrenoidosus.AAC.1
MLHENRSGADFIYEFLRSSRNKLDAKDTNELLRALALTDVPKLSGSARGSSVHPVASAGVAGTTQGTDATTVGEARKKDQANADGAERATETAGFAEDLDYSNASVDSALVRGLLLELNSEVANGKIDSEDESTDALADADSDLLDDDDSEEACANGAEKEMETDARGQEEEAQGSPDAGQQLEQQKERQVAAAKHQVEAFDLPLASSGASWTKASGTFPQLPQLDSKIDDALEAPGETPRQSVGEDGKQQKHISRQRTRSDERPNSSVKSVVKTQLAPNSEAG